MKDEKTNIADNLKTPDNNFLSGTLPSYVPFYDEGDIKIYNEDMLNCLPSLTPTDLIITDFPYNVGFDYGNDSDKKELDVYLEWLDKAMQLINGALAKGGNFVFFIGEKYLPEKIAIAQKYFNYEWVICWYKPNAMQFGKTGYSKHSLIHWYSKDGGKIKGKMIDVIVDNMAQEENKIAHPSPKNIKVIKHLVENFSDKESIIYDPFMGSGTTLLAAKELGRKAVGIEINKTYCNLAKQRLSQEVLFS